MSYDALMRWEWEGGYPALVNEWDEVPRAEPAGNDTLAQPLPASGRRRLRRTTTPSPSPPEDRQSDGRER